MLPPFCAILISTQIEAKPFSYQEEGHVNVIDGDVADKQEQTGINRSESIRQWWMVKSLKKAEPSPR